MPRSSKKKRKSKASLVAQKHNKETKMATGGHGTIDNVDKQGEQTIHFDQPPPALNGQIMNQDGQDGNYNQPPNYSQNQNNYNNQMHNQMHGTQISGMHGMQGMQSFPQVPPPPYYNKRKQCHSARRRYAEYEPCER